MRRGVALLLSMSLCGTVVAGCTTNISFNGVRGEGSLVTETREAAAFDGIDVGGGMHVRLSIGSPQSVTLEAEQNILDILDVVVSDGTLSIDNRDSYSTSKGVTLTIVVPELTAVSLSGGADGRVTALNADRLTVDVSGGAQLDVTGEVTSLDVTASGGGKAYLDTLSAQTVTIDASGGAQARIKASERVTGDASGGASVRVTGDASVNVSVSGGATLN
jgi:hypothetical protein